MWKAIQDRPWIWVIVGTLLMMGVAIAFVVIAVKNAPQSVPIEKPAGWTPSH